MLLCMEEVLLHAHMLSCKQNSNASFLSLTKGSNEPLLACERLLVVDTHAHTGISSNKVVTACIKAATLHCTC